ncbi:MAG: hypothetical protein K2Q32_03295, partial [Alphaproteobacteria bacterium]|nr:hypothetical protein [Alphaproteobacteria bacterium]
MAATFVTVGGTNYPLPSNSSNLWHGRDVIETRKPSAKLFHALLEETGETDDAGRPILELSKRIAVNYALLEQNEAPRGEHNPVVSAYKKVVDAEPHKYIRLSELADENCGRAKGLYTLFGQWALFHQPEG